MTSKRPHTRDQSNKDVAKSSMKQISKLSKSSKVRRLLSCHNIHIKHNGTRFQTSEECFLNQFLHSNKRSNTFPGSTQWIPKEWKTKLHNPAAIKQCSKRWSTISPLHRHGQNHPTRVCPCFIRLSQVRIFPKAPILKERNPTRCFDTLNTLPRNFWAQEPVKAMENNQTSKTPLPFNLHRNPSLPSQEGSNRCVTVNKHIGLEEPPVTADLRTTNHAKIKYD